MGSGEVEWSELREWTPTAGPSETAARRALLLPAGVANAAPKFEVVSTDDVPQQAAEPPIKFMGPSRKTRARGGQRNDVR